MVDIDEALRLLKVNIGGKKITSLPLSQSQFHILAEDIEAKRDGPPFDRVAMDGIAILWSDYEKGLREFSIFDIQAAGGKKLTCPPQQCLEVMTGAVLPQNTDTVIPIEHIKKSDRGIACLDESKSEGIKPRQNIHSQGYDYRKGEALVRRGTFLRSPEIAVLAANGHAEVSVYRYPRIGVGVSGDELVELTQTPLPHQIWMSNRYAITAELQTYRQPYSYFQNKGVEEDVIHLPDDPEILKSELSRLLNNNDLLVLSGGVSKGKFDYIPEVLESLGVKKIFHRVSQRPGQPLYLGKGDNGNLIFGLPGNPVSCIINLRRFVIPAIWSFMGRNREDHDRIVRLNEDFEFPKPLTYFLPVKVSGEWVNPLSIKGSGDYRSLIHSDGFVELNKEKNNFERGEKLKLFQWG